MAPYIGAQVAAGVLAAIVSEGLTVTETSVSAIDMDTNRALTAEFLYTFALVYVILNVATSEATDGNGYYGGAISFVVLAGALTVGEISGGSFNPAVSCALLASGYIEMSDLWMHLVPQFIAGVLAVQAFRATHPTPDHN